VAAGGQQHDLVVNVETYRLPIVTETKELILLGTLVLLKFLHWCNRVDAKVPILLLAPDLLEMVCNQHGVRGGEWAHVCRDTESSDLVAPVSVSIRSTAVLLSDEVSSISLH
jgi:hypothetical protein